MTVKKPMTTKDWFRSIRGIDARVRAMEAQKERFMSLAMRAGVGSFEATRVSGTGNRSRVENGVIDSVDIDDEISRDIQAMLRMRQDVVFVISEIEDVRLREVLTMYYLSNWTWMHIADERGCDVRWVHVLHAKALAEARKVLSKNQALVHCYSLSDCDIV